MYSVTLNGWSPGFLAVRLIELLRDNRFALAEAHHLATSFVDGQRLTIIFQDSQTADRFAAALRVLNVDADVSPAYAAAG